MHLRGRLEELPRRLPSLRRLLPALRPQPRSAYDLRRLCDRLLTDARVDGLFLRLEELDAGYPVLASVRVELARLRAAGKRVVCYLPLGAGQRELYVASAADCVLAMPHAGFSTLGPAASRTYLADLLARIGVSFLVTAEGRYKSAADPLVRSSMSAPEREQLQAIVQLLHDDWTSTVGSRETLGVAGALRLFEEGMYGAERARELGAIDACAYDDQITAELALPADHRMIAHDRYLARTRARASMWLPRSRPRHIALVRLVGTIRERSGTGGIDLHGTSALLRRLARAKHIAGVILYVDSPGGSALVSELLHRELLTLDQQKPVVTWMGNVAASGGYYLAAATRAIIAHPTTLTGSIGVISLKPVAERLLALLELHREVVSMTPFADLHSVVRVPTAEEQALLRGETSRFYRRFLSVVAQGRKRTESEIAQLAEGRVWTGRHAHDHGLVDVLGGYPEARALLEGMLKQAPGGLAAAPLLFSPARLDKPAPLPEPLPAQEIIRTELATLRELAQVLATGEHALAYAIDLPRLA
jgi:protease IV